MEVKLAEMVWKESDLLELLDISLTTLNYLRDKRGFPYIKLGKGKRAYLANSVLGWMEAESQLSVSKEHEVVECS